jgi:hypothetical protein
MVQRLKAQDLLKHIQQKLPEIRELRDFYFENLQELMV